MHKYVSMKNIKYDCQTNTAVKINDESQDYSSDTNHSGHPEEEYGEIDGSRNTGDGS